MNRFAITFFLIFFTLSITNTSYGINKYFNLYSGLSSDVDTFVSLDVFFSKKLSIGSSFGILAFNESREAIYIQGNTKLWNKDIYFIKNKKYKIKTYSKIHIEKWFLKTKYNFSDFKTKYDFWSIGYSTGFIMHSKIFFSGFELGFRTNTEDKIASSYSTSIFSRVFRLEFLIGIGF